MLSPGLAHPPPGTGDGLRDRDMSELGVPATRDKAPGHLSARFGETNDGKAAQRSAAPRGASPRPPPAPAPHRATAGAGPAFCATGEAGPLTSCRHPEGTQVSGSRRTRTWNRRERRHSGLKAQVLLLLRRPLAVVQSEVGGGGGSSAVMGSRRPVAARRRRRRGAVWSEGSQLDCRWGMIKVALASRLYQSTGMACWEGDGDGALPLDLDLEAGSWERPDACSTAHGRYRGPWRL